jgi:hypothetical protein
LPPSDNDKQPTPSGKVDATINSENNDLAGDIFQFLAHWQRDAKRFCIRAIAGGMVQAGGKTADNAKNPPPRQGRFAAEKR